MIALPIAAQTAIWIATVILVEFEQSRGGVFCGTHRPVSFESDMTHTIPHLTFDIFNDDTWTALQNVACPKLPHQRVVRLDFWVPTRDNGFLVREASMTVQEHDPSGTFKALDFKDMDTSIQKAFKEALFQVNEDHSLAEVLLHPDLPFDIYDAFEERYISLWVFPGFCVFGSEYLPSYLDRYGGFDKLTPEDIPEIGGIATVILPEGQSAHQRMNAFQTFEKMFHHHIFYRNEHEALPLSAKF